MEQDNRSKSSYTKHKHLIIFPIILFIVFLGLLYFLIKYSDQKPEILNPLYNSKDTMNESNADPDEGGTPLVVSDNIKMLYPTKENGRVWYAKWDNRKTSVVLNSGHRDPFDAEFIVRGNGEVKIDDKGIAHMSGDSPRMYIYDHDKKLKWDNVEVTVYAKRISETDTISSQGIVIGERSEHQNATLSDTCSGKTYYGRLLYDGRAVFQKEVIHEGAYSVNKPSEINKAKWDTKDGTMPYDVWIGVKFVVYTNPDNKSVKLELYRDLTDGLNGGTWEKVAEYIDNGSWALVDPKINVEQICGNPASKVFLDPGTSVFIRNDKVSEVQYKLFSIREISN